MYLVHGQAFNVSLGFRIAKYFHFSHLVVITSVVNQFDTAISCEELVKSFVDVELRLQQNVGDQHIKEQS